MAPRTRKNTLARLRHHVVPLLGDKRVSAVSVDDVNDMIRRVTNGETRRIAKSEHSRGRIVVTGGAGAARKVSSDLSIVFAYAVERKILLVNPVTGARKPRAGKRHDYLRAEHLEAIGKALSQLEKAGANPSGIAILRLLLMTGARPSEIEGLKWSEIDFSANSLRLTDSKTGYSIRPLATAPLAILAEVQRHEGSEYVFPATRGDGYYTGSKKLWNRAREVAGLPDRVRYHARHAVATLALGAGHDVASVSAIMGHKGPRTTLSTYSHVIDDRAARAAESIGGQIAATMEGRRSANVVSLRNNKSRSRRERH